MDPFIGEIRVFAGNYAPRGWAFCDGQIMTISQNTALYSILGTTYGGDGMSYFALPDLRGRATMHQGHGAGLTPRTLGEFGGVPTVTLNEAELPSHSHTPNFQSNPNTDTPENSTWANVQNAFFTKPVYSDAPNTIMSPVAIEARGGNQAHNNMQPYLGLNFIIALEGTYPPHS